MERFLKLSCKIFLAGALIACLVGSGQTVPWMFQPTNQPGSLGNNYFEYQNYGGSPYYHDGIDVLKSTGGVPVYSVSDGWMTHETAGTMYGGIMIGDQYASGAEGWLYWHLPNSTYPFNVGDRINVGDYIGDIAYWSVYSFHHTHFNRVLGTGGLPWTWYSSIDNPLDWMEPATDPQPPTIHNALTTQLFAFCTNNTSTYLNPNNLSGDVDIIAKLGDKFWNNQYEVVPYRIEYTISGAAIYDRRLAFLFTGVLPSDVTVPVVFKDDATCNTMGDYQNRHFYFIMTNNDGDNTIESTDTDGKWHTAGYPAGAYSVGAHVWDEWGNLTEDSMSVNLPGVPAHNVSITMTPTSSLTLPASGGSFTYTVNVHNSETTTVNNFEGWIEMTYPSGSMLTVLLRTISLPAGGTVTRNLTQTIAGSEPNGTYTYMGKVGYQPYNLWDSDGFTFTKGLDDGAGLTFVSETSLQGWDEEDSPTRSVVSNYVITYLPVNVNPNPFNPATVLRYEVPVADLISLCVYDLSGREVSRLVEGWQEAGLHQVEFDASALPSGLYFYRLQTGTTTTTGKLVLMK